MSWFKSKIQTKLNQNGTNLIGDDSISFYLYIAIIGISFLNAISYIVKQKRLVN